MEYFMQQVTDQEPVELKIIFSPKYHCEIAGICIEYCWGYSKKFFRRFFTLEQKKNDFEECVDQALDFVKIENVWRYAGLTDQYMRAYEALAASGEPVTYYSIEKFRKSFKTHRAAVDSDDGLITADVDEAIESRREALDSDRRARIRQRLNEVSPTEATT